MRKLRKITSIVIALAMVMTLLPSIASAEEDVGGAAGEAQTKLSLSKGADGAYQIGNADELFAFANIVNGGEKDVNAVLTADIDLEGKTWTTICETGLYTRSYGVDLGYGGTFDGAGHTIKNLAISSSTTAVVSCGLFGTVSGTVKNLGIDGVTFTDGGQDMRAGAIVGQLIKTGRITDCYVANAKIEPGEHVVGGIAGCVYEGTIENCLVHSSSVSGTNNRFGHIVGDSRGDGSDTDRPGTVRNCYTDNLPVYSSDHMGVIIDCVGGVSDDTFNSGEIAYKLNGDKINLVWKQTIGADAYPKFTGDTVYQNTCAGRVFYGNADEDYTAHEYSDGICTRCGAVELKLLQDGEGAYLISSADDMKNFSDVINNGWDITYKTFKMTADISVADDFTPVGTFQNPFKGMFDGQNHTLTVTLSGVENTAPFAHTENAKIKNLTTGGTISASGKYAAGIVSRASTLTLNNCISKVDINSFVSGDGTHGGLVGTVVNAAITNCGFVGSISGRYTTSCGGLVGWTDKRGVTAISNSFVAGSFNLLYTSNVNTYHYTFGRGMVSITNCYYLKELQIAEESAVQLTDAAFKSGEAVWRLNGSADNGEWKQTIGTDTYPNFTGNAVYENECAGNAYYSNTAETYDAHEYSSGFCVRCGAHTSIIPTEGVYNISNAGELFAFADIVNSGTKDANAVLTTDIDLEGRPWTTICETGLYHDDYGADLGYSGTFDGAGYTVKNLALSSSKTEHASCGLFGTVSGTVKKLGVDGVTFTDGGKDMRTGAIGGQLIKTGLISNCYVANAVITPDSHVVGGIAGGVYEGTVENCIVYSSSFNGYGTRFGDIAGDSRGDKSTTDRFGTIKNCYTDGARAVSTQIGTIIGCADGVSADIFKSGEIAYTLNGDQTNIIWKQTIGTDNYPKFTGEQVSKVAGMYMNFSAKGEYSDETSNIEWFLGKDGTLIITGEGELSAWASPDKAPWTVHTNDITRLVIDAGITAIDNTVLAGYLGLMEINVNEDNANYSSECGVLCNKDKTTLIAYPVGKADESYKISETVTSIEDNAFSGCANLTVDIPQSVTTIADNAFVGCAESFAIRGFADSAAQAYAKEKNITFITLSVLAMPDIKIDYKNETLTGFEDGAYIIDGKEVTPVDGMLDAGYYMRRTISIVRKGDGDTVFDSPAQILKVPGRAYDFGDIEGFTVTQPTQIGGKGIISGITSDMEYHTTIGESWIKGSGEDVAVDGGSYVQIQKGATDTSFASEVLYETRIVEIKTDDTCPYIIRNLDDFLNFYNLVSSGEETEGYYYKLEADIDLSEVCGENKGWVPIGKNPYAPYDDVYRPDSFNGTFDGNGHTITNLYTEDMSTGDKRDYYTGLFGCIGEMGTVKNLNISGTVEGLYYVGAICGYNAGNVIGCTSFAPVKGYCNAGGLVGCNVGKMTGCSNTGEIIAEEYYEERTESIGGLVGRNSGTVTGCYNTGNVTGDTYVGGVIGGTGGDRSVMMNCYNTGTVKGTMAVGGVIGWCYLTGKAVSCYNTGAVTGATAVGGVVGENAFDSQYDLDGIILTNCYYLVGTAEVGINNQDLDQPAISVTEEAGKLESKTAEEFADGLVTHLLQSGQEAQAWGQSLTEDEHPVLTSEADKAVYKVTFATKDNAEYAVKYANPWGVGANRMPTPPESTATHAFYMWAQTENADGEEFTAQTQLTEDITVYAIVEEKYGENDNEKSITTICGIEKTQDLSEHTTFAGETSSKGKFNYTIESNNGGLPGVDAKIDGDILTILDTTAAGEYTLTIKATEKEPVLSLMSLEYGTEPVTFDIAVTVNPVEENSIVFNEDGDVIAASKESGDYCVIFAAYNNGTLQSVTAENVTFEDARVKIVKKPEDFDDSGADTVKAFFWSSFNHMRCLCAGYMKGIES